MSESSKSYALHRHTYVVWQVSTFALTALVAAGVLTFAEPGTVGWPTYAGLGFLALLSAVASLTYSRLLTPRWRIVVPVMSLCALTVMGADILPVMPMATMVMTIPLLWLVFEFGRRGLVVAVVALAGILTMVYLVDVIPSGSGPGWLQFLPIPLSGIGLLFGAHQIAATLARREHQLVAQARELRSTLDSSEDQLLMLRGVLETIDAVIVAYDADGELIWDNPAAVAVAERAGITTAGHPAGQLRIYAEDQVTALRRDEIPLARAHRGEEFDAQLTWFGEPGDQQAHLLSARQIRRAGDDVRHGYVIVGLEVTDLLQAIRVREEFLTTVSHELRTPLTSIMGYHELLEDAIDPADAPVLKMLAVAQRNAQILLNRVGQLLQASGDGETRAIERRRVDLPALVETALTKHHPGAETLTVQLQHQVEHDLKGSVDPDAFEQVVDNLVSNALKHTPPGGSVSVCLDRKDDALRLRVADTGSGLTPAEQRHAFDRFYRTANANAQAIQGLGVGLSVVKSIVEAHDGEVTVTSNPGFGTTFTVTIPDEDARTLDAAAD
ncbi:ATP-binding protein [Nocardioides gilvus]|uniref:ATP-binding protein n=1 Tax=Nocardioides gilvus TaxID=1735589 RepID=UPI000D74B9FE|nr:ATP-binding protein [Nocardioides gilvus]